MNLKNLHTFGGAVQALAKATITDPKLKVKVTKINIWFEAELKLMNAGLSAIAEKFPVDLKIDAEGKWIGTEEEFQKYIKDVKPKNEAEKEFLESTSVDVEIKEGLILTEDEVSTIADDSINAEILTGLVNLGLLVL